MEEVLGQLRITDYQELNTLSEYVRNVILATDFGKFLDGLE